MRLTRRTAILVVGCVIAWLAWVTHDGGFGKVLGLMEAQAAEGKHEHRREPEPGGLGFARMEMNAPAVDFTLTNQDGKKLSLGELKGKVVLLTFAYTSCPDICPLLTAQFANIQRRLKESGYDDFFLLLITVDPEVDTPEVLKAYANRFQADLSSWAFLTGDRAELANVWGSYGLFFVRKREDGLVDHTVATTLIDQAGRQRVRYLFGLEEEAVLHDIERLVKRGS